MSAIKKRENMGVAKSTKISATDRPTDHVAWWSVGRSLHGRSQKKIPTWSVGRSVYMVGRSGRSGRPATGPGRSGQPGRPKKFSGAIN